MLGVTAIALESQAQIVNSPACLTTSLWYLARERLPYIVAFTLGALSFFNLLLVILHNALARSLLEIPRAKRLQQIERWFCGVLFGIVCIATAVSVTKAGLRCDPAPVLAVHAAKIRAGDYPSSILSEALEPLAVELRRKLHVDLSSPNVSLSIER